MNNEPTEVVSRGPMTGEDVVNAAKNVLENDPAFAPVLAAEAGASVLIADAENVDASVPSTPTEQSTGPNTSDRIETILPNLDHEEPGAADTANDDENSETAYPTTTTTAQPPTNMTTVPETTPPTTPPEITTTTPPPTTTTTTTTPPVTTTELPPTTTTEPKGAVPPSSGHDF